MNDDLVTLIDRLTFHAEQVERAGHLNAARYMHQAVEALYELDSFYQKMEALNEGRD